jgi:hypothetical protein
VLVPRGQFKNFAWEHVAHLKHRPSIELECLLTVIYILLTVIFVAWLIAQSIGNIITLTQPVTLVDSLSVDSKRRH